MDNNKKLYKAKEMVDNFKEEYESDHPMFTDEDIYLLKWLIEQAETTEELKKENRNLQITIGKYAGQIQDLIGRQQTLCREGLSISRNMFRVDLD